MTTGRREFFRKIAVSGLALPALAASASERKIRAVAFDAFPILDPRPVFALVSELFPERGAELSSAWRTHQLEYTFPAGGRTRWSSPRGRSNST